MKRFLACLVAAGLAGGAAASWYWPFGDDEDEQPRLSELMEKASLAIDDASDLARSGDYDKAVSKYREALKELDTVERDNPERAVTPEFATLRNKRAYVNASIDTILLTQARGNARAIAITDTTELERKVAAARADRNRKADKLARPGVGSQLGDYMKRDRAAWRETQRRGAEAKAAREAQEKILELLHDDPKSRPAQLLMVGEDMRTNNLALAKFRLEDLLQEEPRDSAALNMLAACEALAGHTREAETALEQAIAVDPEDWHAYYNFANLMLQSHGNREAARNYYQTGRDTGGPVDRDLEKKLEDPK